MQKSSTLKGVAVILLVAFISYLVWNNGQPIAVETKLRFMQTTYQTSSTRTANVGKYCEVNTDRSSLVTPGQISSAKSNQKSVNSALGIDGNLLINKLANGDTGGAFSMITSNVVNLAIFIGVFIVPFLVFLWIWPFLCCCCCCPSCCPSRCCQHPEDQPYTKCELYWPVITLILALLLVISTAIYGFVNASNFGSSFTSVSCSLAIFTDDLLNGNVTISNTSFFTGLKVFASSLNSLQNNLTNLNTSLSDLNKTGVSSASYNAVTQISTVTSNYVNKLPNGLDTLPMMFDYQSPINQNTAQTISQPSTFPTVLGTYTTNNTLMYKLYASIQYVRLSLQAMKDSASVFSSSTGTINSQIAPMQLTINNLIADVNKMDDKLNNFLSLLKTPSTYGNMGMQGFYGFLIGFSFFSLLGVLLMACCDKTGCRHLMYLSCIFLFLGALLAFIIAVIFSIMVPFFTWTCSYLDVAVSSDGSFRNNFGAFLSNKTVTQISCCMPYGDGNIVNQVAGSAANGINNLTSLIDALNKFNNVTLQGVIQGNLTYFANQVNAYANGDISDLDTSNNNILAGFSDPGNSAINSLCTGFTDSWVPSNNQDTTKATAIYCKSTSTNKAGRTACTSPLNGASCNGCMDTTQILTQYANTAQVTNDIQAKYGVNCAFRTSLANAWGNYFYLKYMKIGYPASASITSPNSTLLGRLARDTPKINDTTDATSVFAGINAFGTQVSNAKTSLATIQNLTDPNYGILSGLNCKLFGQDFVTFQNVICGSFYNNLYLVRLTFGICAWGILFVLCCSVCSGVRHYKQQDKLNKIGTDADFKNDHQPTKYRFS